MSTRVVVVGGGAVDGFAAVLGDVHAGAGTLQELQRELLVDGVVLGHQDVSAFQDGRVALAHGGRSRDLRVRVGQLRDAP